MFNLTKTFDSLDQLPDVASELLETFSEERFFAFFGKMGVGKTTLIRELCDQLGVDDNVCSPTFAIVNEYTTAKGDPVYHFDFYRLKNIDEAYDIGYEEYFYSGEYCNTEWTKKIKEIIPPHYLRVKKKKKNEIRTLIATVIDD